jgi:Protein of unknown function (DUF1453)
MTPDIQQMLPYLLPVLLLVLVLRRSLRERKLKAERLWIMPVLVLAIGAMSLIASWPGTLLAVIVILAALLLGSTIGWWRGRLTHIAIDPTSHELTSRASPVGVLLIGAVFAARYALRVYEVSHPTSLPGGAALGADALLVFAIGAMAVQRLEMWLRCQRLIAVAKAS